jgi:hypothetical protein
MQLVANGFEGLAIEYVEADPAMILFLIENARLHQTVRTSQECSSVKLI